MKPSDVLEDIGIAATTLAGYSAITSRWAIGGVLMAIGGVAWVLAAKLRSQGN